MLMAALPEADRPADLSHAMLPRARRLLRPPLSSCQGHPRRQCVRTETRHASDSDQRDQRANDSDPRRL